MVSGWSISERQALAAAIAVWLGTCAAMFLTAELVLFGMSDFGISLLSLIYGLPVLLLVQVAMLLLPIRLQRGRPVPQRSVKFSLTLISLPVGLTFAGMVCCILLVILGEDPGFEIAWYALLMTFPIFWVIAGVVFYQMSLKHPDGAFIERMKSRMLQTSLLGLAVGVPSHIISRMRGECCAPLMGFWLLLLSLCLALIAFGPGLYFLFRDRIERKRRIK